MLELEAIALARAKVPQPDCTELLDSATPRQIRIASTGAMSDTATQEDVARAWDKLRKMVGR